MNASNVINTDLKQNKTQTKTNHKLIVRQMI